MTSTTKRHARILLVTLLVLGSLGVPFSGTAYADLSDCNSEDDVGKREQWLGIWWECKWLDPDEHGEFWGYQWMADDEQEVESSAQAVITPPAQQRQPGENATWSVTAPRDAARDTWLDFRYGDGELAPLVKIPQGSGYLTARFSYSFSSSGAFSQEAFVLSSNSTVISNTCGHSVVTVG